MYFEDDLSGDDLVGVNKIMTDFGITEFNDAFVRCWGRGSDIQIDGDVNLNELKCLVAISEYLS